MLFFFLKIAVPPLLVAVMSLAARRWGPTVGGLVMGLPWMTGPVLFFLALDKDEAFAVAACTGIELGIFAVCAYMLAYSVVSGFARWPLSLAAASAAFLAAARLVRDIDVPLTAAAAAAAAGLALTYILQPRPRTPAIIVPLPWWDLPLRMLATLALVAVITLSADVLGPQLSGIAATFPAILTVIGAFTHHQWGTDAVRRVLRGLTLALFAFVAFFLVVGATLPAVGLVASYLLATAAALPISGLLLVLNRRGFSR